MKLTFKLSNDHIVARLDDGRLALLDTGSPFSLANGTFEFGWESHRPLLSIPDAATLSEQVESRIDVLVGMDLLRTLCLAIDWEHGEIEVLPGAPPSSGFTIPMMATVGELSFVTTDCDDRKGKWIVDTGARVSFVKEWIASETDEQWKDFVLQGEVCPCEEPSRLFEITLADCRRQGRVARLPSTLSPALTLAKADGILGMDWLKQSALILDFANGKMVVTC